MSAYPGSNTSFSDLYNTDGSPKQGILSTESTGIPTNSRKAAGSLFARTVSHTGGIGAWGEARPLGKIPQSPGAIGNIPIYKPDKDTPSDAFLAIMALQVLLTDDSNIVVSCMVSAGIEILDLPKVGTSYGFTRQAEAYPVFVSTDRPNIIDRDEKGDNGRIAPPSSSQNWENMPVDAFVELYSASIEELCYMFAMWFLTPAKTPTSSNISFFNSKRVNSLDSLTVSRVIFNDGSPYLDLDTLKKISRAWNGNSSARIHFFKQIVALLDEPCAAGRNAFVTPLSTYASGIGLSTISVVQIVTQKFPNFFLDFPEFQIQGLIVATVAKEISTNDDAAKYYVKFIYGSKFVPFGREINELFVAALHLARTIEPHYKNFAPTKIPTSSMVAVLDKYLADRTNGAAVEVVKPLPTS